MRRNATTEMIYAAEVVLRLVLVIALMWAALYTSSAFTLALAGLMLVGLVARAITLWAWWGRKP